MLRASYAEALRSLKRIPAVGRAESAGLGPKKAVLLRSTPKWLAAQGGHTSPVLAKGGRVSRHFPARRLCDGAV